MNINLLIKNQTIRSIIKNYAKNCVVYNKKIFVNRLSTKVDLFNKKLINGPDFKEFLGNKTNENKFENKTQQDEFDDNDLLNQYKKIDSEINCKKHFNVFYEVYGCLMNVNDTEIVMSVLDKCGIYKRVDNLDDADVILLMTCSIREGAETKIWNRLVHLREMKKKRNLKVGLLGCMAERLKEKILDKEKIVDVICGPDAYKSLPHLLDESNKTGSAAMNVQLSLDETYADISPLRINQYSKTAFVSIQRGCDNMCSFCIVPFVRGRERSRPILSILDEIRKLSDSGIKDVTLLGQNVNSYRDLSETSVSINTDGNHPTTVPGFKTVYKPKLGGKRFTDLLDAASSINPEIRLRFTSPHPKDFPDSLLHLMKERNNICKHIHLPAQSGSTTCLERMRRGYTREAYLDLVDKIRSIIPDVGLSSDFIAGFCGETDEEHNDTVSLMRKVRYNFCFTFPYSLREKTKAYRRFKDDVPLDVKKKRHNEITEAFRECALEVNRKKIGEIHLVLVEGESKRSNSDLTGRNDNNTVVIFEKCELPESSQNEKLTLPQTGDYVACRIVSATSQTLRAIPLYLTKLQSFYSNT